MRFPYISGRAEAAPPDPLVLPVPDRQKQTDPARYLPDADLVDAVNVALVLGQPLLLTGEPGTGKTQLAFRLAWELGYGEPLVFNTKSISTARDLFYTFDTLRRFHAAQTGQGSQENLDYLVYNALGVAILHSHDEVEVKPWLPAGFVHRGPRRCVVLIDEIDKAPRDFPNDLLHEVENMSFRVPELGNVEIRADRDRRPVLVVTSNSEKNLPDAFLRRCVYYNIPQAGKERLLAIIHGRLDSFKDGSSALLDSAIDLFLEIRQQNLRKPPSTAELLNWLQVLVERRAALDKPVLASPDALRGSLSTLAKVREDAEEIAQFVRERLGS